MSFTFGSVTKRQKPRHAEEVDELDEMEFQAIK